MDLKKALAFLVILAIPFLVFSYLFGGEPETQQTAPGCNGGGGITGCLGKSFIRNASLEPAFNCVRLDPNNCNGGVLGVENHCEDDLTIGGVVVAAGEFKNVELVREAGGAVAVVEPEGNFDSYNPETADELGVYGTLGAQAVQLSYVKENVCGEPKKP